MSVLQKPPMVLKVIPQKRGDEVIAVVVARLQAQGQRVMGGVTRGLQQLGAQLAGQVFVGLALVHQQVQPFREGRGHQGRGIPRSPRLAVFAQVRAQRLLAPGHLAGRHDG